MKKDIKVFNKMIPEDEFMSLREEALKIWPTGSEINLNDGIDYMLKLTPNRIAAILFDYAEKNGLVLVHPRGGTVPLEAQIDLVRYLEAAGADIVPVNNDNYSRQMRFDEAQKGLERTIREGRVMLNGFPAIIYGIKGCRKITEAVNVPVSNRFGPERDCRIGVEIGCASGMNYYVMSAFGINFSYNKDLPLEDTIKNTQYSTRLLGIYEKNGAPMVLENYMTLTGTLIPPGMAISCLVIDALLAAEQGVKRIVQQFGICGCINQDIAAIRALEEICAEYLENYGYKDVKQYPACAQYMGAFPLDEAKAFGIITLGALTAILGGARMVITKTPEEAYGIPSKEANAQGVKATIKVLDIMKGQAFYTNDEIELEKNMIKEEVKSIISKVLEVGDGDILKGSLVAFNNGIMDIPFSPSKYNMGKVMPIRDSQGAIRYMDSGNVPLSSEVKEYHLKKINSRMKMEKDLWQAIYNDIVFASY